MIVESGGFTGLCPPEGEVSLRVSWTDRSQIRELEKNCALGDNALMN